MKVRDILKLLRGDGWTQVAQKGSHRQFKHPTKRGKVTVNGHPRDDVQGDLLASILKQAGLK
jgi:predicted RNA binding protein YcfA (HicA-like mRNA interferase family)